MNRMPMPHRTFVWTAALCLFTLAAALPSRAEDSIRVLIWDEQQPTQKSVYPNFLGNQIAAAAP